ncbi:MAG: thiamine pyrophosphate-dependent dehydrogenase E1 component subunit alpha [Ktedonobacteraceae bacterium]|nr:thiamine pyrophosphate-dependent dehydrogenase E1 component subunit alpha [Ktedonobacteraceae bacterium]
MHYRRHCGAAASPESRDTDLYARMLLTRIVDAYIYKLLEQGRIPFAAHACGLEAIQVGSAVCIERGTDFTLPYYRDLGVVLTIGMTPYEVFRTSLQSGQSRNSHSGYQPTLQQSLPHWGYHKHNTVTGAGPVATQILHAAGIAFASKLRQAPAVTIAYCGDGAETESDFHEGLRFAAQHRLPIVVIYERAHQQAEAARTAAGAGFPFNSLMAESIAVPDGVMHRHIDGTDITAVYSAMRSAVQQAREGRGPSLLEMHATALSPHLSLLDDQHPGDYANVASQSAPDLARSNDPLLRYQHILRTQGAWDDTWAAQLYARLVSEVEQALQDALRDTLC